jgi:hypothetical protein
METRTAPLLDPSSLSQFWMKEESDGYGPSQYQDDGAAPQAV